MFVEGTSNEPVKSVLWTFSNGLSDDPLTEDINEASVKIGFTSTMKNNAVKIDFKHNGVLPGGTTVIIDVGDKFANGTVINVFHLDENNEKDELITGYFVVQDGQVAVPLEHCSAYLLEVNNGLTNIVPVVTPDDVPDEPDDDGGINFLLIGGIGVGVVAVIGLGAFFFLRRQ